jgi:pimeloyl-ACP methyl ester carboxylesterase
VELYFERWGDTGPPLLILHGLFGSSRNWRSISRRLAENRLVYTVDQRNHGKSCHASALDYAVLADDAREFIDKHGIGPVAVVGHSMGGKVAATLALESPNRVTHLVVVDIPPFRRATDTRTVLDAMLSANASTCASREEVDQRLVAMVPDARTRSFLLTNLERDQDGVFAWRVNLAAIDAHFDEIAAPIGARGTFEGPALFVSGGRSEQLRNSDRMSIRGSFPIAQFVEIKEAGHWVHADAPDRFFEVVVEFLSRPTRSD